MANSAFTPAVLTVSGSSSTSSGEKNYVTATDGNASGLWASSGAGVTVGTSTSTLPDNITKTTSLSIARNSGSTDYARYRFTLDQADYGKNFKISWDQVYSGTAGDFQLQVWSNTASNYGGTATKLTVQTASVPAITGSFVTSVDMPGSTAPYIEIRIVATAGTTLYLGSILVGPGTIVQGGVISSPVSFTPSFQASALGTLTNTSAFFERHGERMFASGTFTAGTVTGSNANLNLPNSLTANSTAASGLVIGRWQRNASGATTRKSGNIFVIGGNTFVYFSSDDQAAAISPFTAVAASSLFGNSDIISFEFSLDIAEWSGSGTVNLGPGAQVEYASNNGTWDATDSSTFVYGPAGVQMGGNLTSARRKRVRFQYPIQADDQLVLELSSDGTVWTPASTTSGSGASVYGGGYTTVATGVTAGISLERVSATDVDVLFGQYRDAILADGSSPTNWGTTYRWRVRKAKASSPVGFGLAGTDGSAGLYKPGKAPGQPNGSAIGDGYIGETKPATLGGIGKVSPAIGTYYDDSGTIELGAGVWLVTLVASVVGDAPTNINVQAVPVILAAIRSGASTVESFAYGCSGVVNGVSVLDTITVQKVINTSGITLKASIAYQPNTSNAAYGTISMLALGSRFYAVRIA